VTENLKRIQCLYFDAGGGHRAAANALKSVIEQQGRPWEISLVNLQELLYSLDIFRKITGISLENIYNRMLAQGWTLGSATGLRFMHLVLRAYHNPMVTLLERHWKATTPDLVVSLVPNFNRPVYDSLHGVLPKVRYVTILTDFADYPPHFWMEKQAQYLICGTEKAVEQARGLGYAADRIFRASGMILRPKFYQPVTADRAVERKKLGLDPNRTTGLVLFGGQGSSVMVDIARGIPETQLILICGRNEGLAAKLRALQRRAPHFVEGFTGEIPYYMHLADFFIGKPGPGSISEAVAMKLPVIVESNAWTLPQERYNTEWVRERGVGLVLKNFRGIDDAVRQLEASLGEYRTRVAAIENRAVFEIPDMLARLL
jgi:hypothetical protein